MKICPSQCSRSRLGNKIENANIRIRPDTTKNLAPTYSSSFIILILAKQM